MFIELDVTTTARQELRVITEDLRRALSELGVDDGVCFLFCPHTTAGLTINSYLDPATATDLVHEIDRIVPTRTDFVHVFDTPSDAAGHIKTSLIGGNLSVIIDKGELKLGSSQGILFWEFDGPRKRKVYVKVLSN